MHQHTLFANIIGVEISNLEVVNIDWLFEYLMLSFLNNYILAVDQNKNISGTKINRGSPTNFGNVERMLRSCCYFLTIDSQVYKFICLTDISFNDFLFGGLAGLRISCNYYVTCFNIFNGNKNSLNYSPQI